MVKLTFTDGTVFDSKTEIEDIPTSTEGNVETKIKKNQPVYDSGTNKTIDTISDSNSYSNVTSNWSKGNITENIDFTKDIHEDLKTTQNDSQESGKETETFTFSTKKRATPLSVYQSFSEGFNQNLMTLPDKTIRKIALGISDTYNLGWKEEDVFQFADLIYKNKLGYMSGSTGATIINTGQGPGLVLGDQYLTESGFPENEWEKWSHLTGDFTALSLQMMTGAGWMNASKVMKYRKLVETKPGTWNWVTDPAKIINAEKKYPGLTAAGQDYLNWVANNPLKAAQIDLLITSGAATGIYTADRQLTPEFKEEHPILSSLVQTGAMVVGSLAQPMVVIGTTKALKGGGILLSKTPFAGTAIKFTGGILSDLLSLRSVAAQRDYIRKMSKTVDKAVYNQIKDVWQAAINDPSSVIPRQIATVTKNQVVGGEALKALRNEFINNGMDDAAISAKLFEMLNDTTSKKILIGQNEFEVGVLAEAALKSYENVLRNEGKLSEIQILEAISNQRLQLSIAQQAPSAKNIATQTSIEAKASGEQINYILQRKQTNENVLKGFYENMFVTNEHAPLIVIDDMSGRILQSNAIKKEILESSDVLSKIASQTDIAPLSGAEAISEGQTIREIIDTNRKLAMKPFEAEDALINTLGPNMNVSNFKDFQKTLLETLYGPTGKATYFENPEEFPLIIQKILNMPSDQKINLLDVWKLYKQITNAAFDAGLAKSLGISGKDAYSNLYMTQQALMDFMKTKMIPLRTLDDGTARSLDKFFSDYKTKVADIYNKGAVFKMNQIQPGGGYYTAPEKVADHFLKSSDTAKNFKVLIDNISDPTEQAQLQTAVRDVILDKIYKSNIINKEGVLDTIKLSKWMEKNDSWLQYWPDIKSQLFNSRKLTNDAGNRIIALKSRHENIERNFMNEKLRPLIDIVNSEIAASAKGTPITAQSVETQGNFIYTVNDLIKKALTDPVLMKRLRDASGTKFSNNPAEKNAFRDLVWQNVGDMIPLENGAKIKQWMESPAGEQVMKLMYTPYERKTLKTLVNAYETVYRIPDPKAIADTTPPGIQKIQEQLGTSVQGSSSIIRAWKEARISGTNTLIYLASRLFSTQQKRKIQALYFEAFSNPDIAAFLSKDLFISNVDKGGFGYFNGLNKTEATKVSRFLWVNGGLKISVEDLMEPPVVISDDSEYMIENGQVIPVEGEGVVESESNTKEKSETTDEIPEIPLSFNRPDIVPASQLANQNTTELVSAAPISNNITEERFSSFYPYDTTGQMIASQNITMAQGGIVNAIPNIRQKVL